jgi:hypothetical protein
VTNQMERILGGPVGFEKVIPGTVARDGKGVIYISDDGSGDFRNQFSRLTRYIKTRNAKFGGKTSQGCRLWLPDGSLFHPIGYHGDIEGWRKDIIQGAQQSQLLYAVIAGESIFVSDGRFFVLSDCKVEFD